MPIQVDSPTSTVRIPNEILTKTRFYLAISPRVADHFKDFYSTSRQCYLLYHAEHMYIICQRLTAQPIRDLFLRLNITTRLHFLRHLEVSLSAAWHGKRDFTKAEQDRFDHCGGVNASRTLVNLNHTKLSDHLLISFISLVEIVQMADRLSYIRLQVNVIKTEAIPRLLTVDRARFNTITDRMRVEAGWVGRREDGLILLAEYRKTD